MGVYIDLKATHGKANELVKKYNVQKLENPPRRFEDIPEDKALIVVVDNIVFDAAAYAHNKKEFEVFTDKEDIRPKEFFFMDKKKAKELTGV